jgi:hypothetical protein
MKTLTLQLILGAALIVPAVFAQAYSPGLVSIPGVVPQAFGIDDDDQVVGYFYSQSVSHGFVLSAGVVAQIDVPESAGTRAYGINSKTGIAGSSESMIFTSGGMVDAGRHFVLKRGLDKSISGINAAGDFVGWDDGTGKGFINSNGVYTVVSPSLCDSLPTPVTVVVSGVNVHDDYVGSCRGSDESTLGFAHVGGVDQTVTVFGYPANPTGINDSGTIAGWFNDGSGAAHSFISTGGNVTQFDFPSDSFSQTAIQGINNHGSLAGIAYDTNTGQWTSFFALAN